MPTTWQVEIEDHTEQFVTDGSAPEFNGRPAESVIASNADGSAGVYVFSNLPYPDYVAVDAQELEILDAKPFDMGAEPSDDVGDSTGLWTRVVIGEYESPRAAGIPTFGFFDGQFEAEDHVLVVAPYLTAERFGDPTQPEGGMAGFRFPFTEEPTEIWWDESIMLIAGVMPGTAAQTITGQQGVEALRSATQTKQFDELVEVMQSFQVTLEPAE